jgi:hypothetical protein
MKDHNHRTNDLTPDGHIGGIEFVGKLYDRWT